MNRLLTGCGVVSTAGVIAWSVLSDKHSGDGGTLGDWLTCPQTLSHCKPAPQTSSSSQPVDERIGTRNSQLAPHCKMCYIKVRTPYRDSLVKPALWRARGRGEREKRAWYTLTAHASNCTRISGTSFIFRIFLQ